MSYDQQIIFILYLQHYIWLSPVMQLATTIGSVELYLLVISAAYWCFNTRLGLRLGLILILSQGLNDCLKIAFHSPRPYWVSREVIPYASYSSFGIPSGHSQNAVCIWGYLASLSKKAWAWSGAFVLIFAIGLSRVYLGAHFPIDVAVGWTVGALILTAFMRLEPRITVLLRNLGLGRQILVSFLASLCLLTSYYLCFMALGGWQIPSSWANSAAIAATGVPIDPLNPRDVLESSGTLLGIGAGYSWLCQRYRFDAKGTTFRRTLRYILGIAVLVLVWFGIAAIEPYQNLLISYFIEYLRAVVAGIWVSAAAPILFMKAGLIERET